MTGMSSPSADPADEARRLLVEHVDRTLVGPVEDPAVVAAVAGVERLVVAAGTTDAQALRGIVLGASRGEVEPDVAMVVAEAVTQVAAGLERRALGEHADAGVINPEAGRHEVVSEATLLRAAVRASQRSFDVMPYYRLRYGGRGARFASTDSAWLVALAAQGEEDAVRQVWWLARVLANRGMPSWLLETHLASLVAELRSTAGDTAPGPLTAAAADLATIRRAHVDDDLLARADTWADELLGEHLPVPHTGLLLAAATADVLSGVTHDDRALVDWLTYPERLSPAATLRVRTLRDRIRATAR